jgi:lipopolysaccharide export system permease protein
VLTSIAVISLNAYLLPESYRQFKDLRFAIRADYSSILLQEGAFHTLPNGITIFIRERKGAGQLNGILVHDAHNPDRPVTLMAEQGALVQTEQGPRVVLINGNRQEIDRDNGKLSLLYFDKYTIDLSVVSNVPRKRPRTPEEMFLWELLDPSLHPEGRSARYMAEGHSRLTAPLLSLDFTIIALAFLLSGDFSRRGQSNPILAAIAAVVLLQTLAIGVRNLANDDPAVNPFMYATVAIPVLVGLFSLIRSHPSRPRRRNAGALPAETG